MPEQQRMRVPLSQPDIGDIEIENVSEVLRGGALSLGPVLRNFEDKFAEFAGTRFAIATSSGTTALHLAVRALGITAGDAVITTSFSFVASTNCFLYEGASPVFLDIDPTSFTLDVRSIRKFLAESCTVREGVVSHRATGRRVKAILPVHVYGIPCAMDEVMNIAREFRLVVIEDACEALGAAYAGAKVGTFGDAATFAFYPNKQMTTAEGGMLVTNDEGVADLCRSMRNQGRDGSGWLRHVRLGYNYRLSDVHAAIGLAQIGRIEELLNNRQNVAEVYNKLLGNTPDIRLPQPPPKATRSWFVYVVQVPTAAVRDDTIAFLRERGVACQAYFPAIHDQPYIRAIPGFEHVRLPNTEHAAATCLAVPFFARMTYDQVSYVCDQLKLALQNCAKTTDAAA